MANLEIEGRLLRKLPVQNGRSARGDWSKQEFIVEFQDGNFPSNVVFNVWGADKVRDLERYNEGDLIKVSFAPSSREFNGRWYTDLRAWRIAPAGQDSAPQQAPRASASAQNVPAGFAPRSYAAPAPSENEAPAPTIDDLPADLGSQFGEDLPF